MVAYRIYTLDENAQVTAPARIIDCKGDDDAIRQARQYLDGKDLEIWDMARFVVRMTPGE